MLPAGCRVLCAVSGGADSVYLLCRLLEMSRERGFSVCAAHYNHGLRGGESDRDEAFVRGLCEEKSVAFVSARGDVAAFATERGMSTEEAARALRYGFLEDAADRLGADRIATAHTADDNAETMLMNLARGAGLRGLGGIPPVRGRLIRPMLTVRRADILTYLAERGLGHVEDSSNATDDYARNRVRHYAVPALISVNAGFVENAARTAALLRADEAFLVSLAQTFINENIADGGVPAEKLAALPRPVSARAVRLLAGDCAERHVDAVLRLAPGEGLGYTDLPGMRVTREQGMLRFGGEDPPEISRKELYPGRSVRIPEADMVITCRVIPGCPEIYSSLNTFFFNYENICGIISCTSRMAGDRIRLSGRNCTKKLSDLFTEKKLSRRQRILTPVLRDSQGVAAVYGFGVAERCAAKPGETVLRIDILKSGRKRIMTEDMQSVLLSEEQIAQRIAEMGAEISRDFRGKDPIFVGVLKGCFVFMADLMRNVDIRCTMDFMAVSSYGSGTTTTGAVKINKDLSQDIEGRHVIIVEDILDSGVTLSYLVKFLSGRSPASITLVTLLDKPARRKSDVKANYVGFEIEDAFVVGYGLDYDEEYRNLPYIGILKPEVYTK